LGAADGDAFVVDRFCEKPDAVTAQTFVAAGPGKFVWNSGMFVLRAKTLLHGLQRYEPELADGVQHIADAYDTTSRGQALERIYSGLKKISVDFAVMEPASRDPSMRMVALPLSLNWTDLGSWNSLAATCPRDEHDNAIAALRYAAIDTQRTLLASDDPDHLVAAVGCDDLVVVHTADATLVCRANHAEAVKSLHKLVEEKFGNEFL